MVFSPGQVRQKGCHFRGVDIIERAVDVPRIWAGALEQCLNYLVAKDVAVHLDLQAMALMLPAFVGRPDPARKCGPIPGFRSMDAGVRWGGDRSVRQGRSRGGAFK